MKRILFVLAAAGLTAAGSTAGAQTIAPECAAAATSANIAQGYDVAFDADRGVCIATPARVGAAVVSSQTAPAPAAPAAAGAGAAAAPAAPAFGAGAAFGGLGVTGLVVGGSLLTFVGISTTGGT